MWFQWMEIDISDIVYGAFFLSQKVIGSSYAWIEFTIAMGFYSQLLGFQSTEEYPEQ